MAVIGQHNGRTETVQFGQKAITQSTKTRKENKTTLTNAKRQKTGQTTQQLAFTRQLFYGTSPPLRKA